MALLLLSNEIDPRHHDPLGEEGKRRIVLAVGSEKIHHFLELRFQEGWRDLRVDDDRLFLLRKFDAGNDGPEPVFEFRKIFLPKIEARGEIVPAVIAEEIRAAFQEGQSPAAPGAPEGAHDLFIQRGADRGRGR